MRIQTKLSFSAVAATVCLVIIGALGFFYIQDIAKLSHKLVNEQAEPIVQANELEKATWEIWSRLIVHTSTSDFELMQNLEMEIKELEGISKIQLEQVSANYANTGLPQALMEFQENWQRFQEKYAEVLQLSQEFSKSDGQNLLLGPGRELFNQALSNLREEVNLHRQEMEHLRKQASTTRLQAGWIVSGITVLVGTALLIMLLGMGRSISRPLETALKTANQIAEGDLTARAAMHTRRDEIGTLLNAMNDMAERLQLTISELSKVFGRFSQGNMNARIKTDFPGDFAKIKSATNEMADNLQTLIIETRQAFGQLAGGNMAVRIEHEFPGDFTDIKQASNEMAEELQGVISETSRVLDHLSQGNMDIKVEREFAGDFGEIKNALDDTASKLSQTTKENDRQSWLKSGQTQLNESISGEQNLIHLAENIINFLVPYLDAQVGAVYLQETSEDKTDVLKMIASHAYVWRKSGEHMFHLGEGLVGQAGLERKLFVITHAPDNYIAVRSGLGKSSAKEILVAPFLYEGQLKGVIEIASFEAFTELQLEFFKQILPNIAIAINTAESRMQMQALLEKTQIQTNQLQQQTVALEQQQADLQKANGDLQAQQEELHQANEELQSQTEELQTQQEELRQSNEELEERTHELEQQRSAIRKQNDKLEKARTAIETKAEELALASKYKSEFLANMSHELRTPLNSLLILAQMLANNKDSNLTEKQVECANTIHSSGSDLLTLINEILDLSKIEAGRIELHVETVQLGDFAASLEQKFRHVADDKALGFEIRQADNLPPPTS